MARRRSGYVQIDACELLDEVDDDDLLDAVASRKLVVASAVPNEPTDMDMVREAYDALQRGHVAEAKVILDRLVFPKWKTPKACSEAYASFFKSPNAA